MQPSAPQARAAPHARATHRPHALTPELHALFQSFEPLTLAELNSVGLLNRTDTKFVLTERQALEILERIRGGYRVLDVKGTRASHYFTQYYDTPALTMYLEHHNGYGDRYKVRTRTYVDSNVQFLEVKHKTNRARTIKSRIAVAPDTRLLGAAGDFVRAHTPYAPESLIDSANNEYLRVSLACNDSVERLTIDFGLSFQWRGMRAALPGLVVAEVKQPRFSTHSSFVQQLHQRHIQPLAFSKYCMSLVILDPTTRYNLFKSRLMLLQHLLRDYLSGAIDDPVCGPLPEPARLAAEPGRRAAATRPPVEAPCPS